MNDEAKEKLLDCFATEAMKAFVAKTNGLINAYHVAGEAYILAEIEDWIKKSQEPNYTMEALNRLMAHLKTGKKDLGKTPSKYLC